jgi:antagonist of KipI
MSLILRETGLFSLLVDGGRPCSRSLGVPLGGAADRAAHALGNALVGNPPDALALEITLAGPTLEAVHPTAIVVFGAPFPIVAGDRVIAAGTTFTLERGEVLRIGTTPTSCRGYVCVAGGFQGREILGSQSSLEPLAAGELACPASRIEARSLPFPTSPKDASDTVRVVDGPQRGWFTDETFFQAPYQVTPACNRMGLRLRGPLLNRVPGELVSEAVSPGAVQVTNDGQPIVLGVDGQTIGGYPKIAHVIRADLDRLAQLRPGDWVRFSRVTLEDATAASRARTKAIEVWLRRLATAHGAPAFDKAAGLIDGLLPPKDVR